MMWRKREKAAALRLLKTSGTIKAPVRQLGLWRERKHHLLFYPIRWVLSRKRSFF
jgi:hypothetical protein